MSQGVAAHFARIAADIRFRRSVRILNLVFPGSVLFDRTAFRMTPRARKELVWAIACWLIGFCWVFVTSQLFGIYIADVTGWVLVFTIPFVPVLAVRMLLSVVSTKSSKQKLPPGQGDFSRN